MSRRGEGAKGDLRTPALRGLLVQRPAMLEPGLRVFPRALELEDDLRVRIAGVDAVGRPLLMLRQREFPASFYDGLLHLAVRWGAAATRLDERFSRPHEPRVMVLADALPREAADRLELLRGAVPLRVRMLRAATDPDGAPRLMPALDPALDSERLAAALPPDGALALRRLLGAAAVIRPALAVEGGDWPLVLRGVDGPCASLHEVDGQLHFAASTANDPSSWKLAGEDSVDRAIDLLLRRQAGVISAA